MSAGQAGDPLGPEMRDRLAATRAAARAAVPTRSDAGCRIDLSRALSSGASREACVTRARAAYSPN